MVERQRLEPQVWYNWAMPDTNHIGNVTEGHVLSALLKSGRNVLVPFGACAHYDLVFEQDGKFYRVQCKTGRLRAGAIRFNLYTMVWDSSLKKSVSRAYQNRIDFYGVYCAEIDRVYLVPSTEVGVKEGALRIEPSGNNQMKNVRWAKDYEL
jgi:hypothetical protein